ncbi:MAG: Xaa-Pro peptidase family protein [Firmicutes bacterium]|jgi:Xaa-Pro aminopeptidase|nr:Xaa-Pro peptidase family protein [Bacillota bacterium]
MEKYLIFTEEEYRARARKLQALMAKNGLDGAIFTKGANLIYFTGYDTSLYNSDFRPFFAVFPAAGEPTLIVPNLELGGARKTSWVEDIRIWGGTKGCASTDPILLLRDVVVEKGLDKSRVGMELSNGQRLGMTVAQFRAMQKELPAMEIADNECVVWPVRMVKSPAEIEYLRKACYANDRGFEAAVEAIRDGATEKEVEIAMAKAMIEHGAHPDFMTITAGLNRYDMCNPRACERVVMRKGDMVVMDFGCRYEHYYADVTRGVFVGEPHPRAAALYRAVEEVNHAALEAAKPGNPVKEIDAAAEKKITELGYRDLMMHRTGHSLGVEVHEQPSIGPAETAILEEGMVLAIEPGLYDFSVGGFRIEDNIVITKTGFEYLTKASRDIIVR